ncbi:unnamed protein product [Schistosoma mattheei]|uniref:Uncharacterized protein n=1 Tax=Schistosoma mattheei TaxID=31246 RepID=A0AA85BA23_9TREM|nr:unnamed protein product [Schistosoma mattheei]
MFKFDGEFFTEYKRIHIYEAVNQLKRLRCFGALCAINTIVWSFFTCNPRQIQTTSSNFQLFKETAPKSYEKMVESFRLNSDTKRLYPWITAVLALSSFLGGILLPRRMIRNIILITAENNNTSALQKFIEVDTHGAFGIKSNGRTFKRPLRYISFDYKSPHSDVSRINIRVKHVPFGFILDLRKAKHIDENELCCLMYKVNQKCST